MYKAAIVVLTLLMTAAAGGQTLNPKPQQSATQENSTEQAANPPAPADAAHQMQLDLDQMDSLVNNMAAQVGFIRDTNMSILLNTNVRLWSVLLRDMRLQMQEQQRHAAEKTSSPPSHRESEKH